MIDKCEILIIDTWNEYTKKSKFGIKCSYQGWMHFKYSKNHLQPFSNAFENPLKSRDKGRWMMSCDEMYRFYCKCFFIPVKIIKRSIWQNQKSRLQEICRFYFASQIFVKTILYFFYMLCSSFCTFYFSSGVKSLSK